MVVSDDSSSAESVTLFDLSVSGGSRASVSSLLSSLPFVSSLPVTRISSLSNPVEIAMVNFSF